MVATCVLKTTDGKEFNKMDVNFGNIPAGQKKDAIFYFTSNGGGLRLGSIHHVDEPDTLHRRRAGPCENAAAHGQERRHVSHCCLNGEAVAAEVPELGHGVLTYAILAGLGGDRKPQASVSSDGTVTVNSLLRYLSEEVPKLSEKYRGIRQNVMQFSTGQDFALKKA
ncbi:MAG: hypothetical protein AB2L14_04270 [Candidatus Xenobiia bacterium LiM19]